MDSKHLKQLVNELAISHGAVSVGKKYVWYRDEVTIFLDVQKSEFKSRAYFINVHYFLTAVSGRPDVNSVEYLGDIFYRFQSNSNNESYSDIFFSESIYEEMNLRTQIENEFTHFIDGVQTVNELKQMITNRPDVTPFMKAAASDYFGVKPKKTRWKLFGLFKSKLSFWRKCSS